MQYRLQHLCNITSYYQQIDEGIMYELEQGRETQNLPEEIQMSINDHYWIDTNADSLIQEEISQVTEINCSNSCQESLNDSHDPVPSEQLVSPESESVSYGLTNSQLPPIWPNDGAENLQDPTWWEIPTSVISDQTTHVCYGAVFHTHPINTK